MTDYNSSGPLARRSPADPPKRSRVPAWSPNLADIYGKVRADHGQEAADKMRVSLEFLNGGPIDTTDTTEARRKRETGK